MAKANEITGGEAMARMLKAFNCGPMFGMGGFQLLAFYDARMKLTVEPGEFEIRIGSSSRDADLHTAVLTIR